MGHPMAKKGFRKRGEKIFKNKKDNNCSDVQDNCLNQKYFNEIEDEDEEENEIYQE